MIDVIATLKENEIPFTTNHKHSTEGWVNVNCPYCNDNNFHMGLNLTTPVAHCWRCGAHNFWKTLKALGCKTNVELTDNNTNHKQKTQYTKKLELPTPAKGLNSASKLYLIKRGFDPTYIRKVYGVFNTLDPDWINFLIIPFYFRGQVVTFQGRRIGGDKRYRTAKKEKSILTPKDMLYNYDYTDSKVIVTEGVTDVWRLGSGAVATSGVTISQKQLKLLTKFDRVFIMFDNDNPGRLGAEDLKNRLNFLGKTDVHIVDYDAKDPGELDDNEAIYLKKQLGFL